MFCDVGKGAKDLLEEDYFFTQRLKVGTTNQSKLSWVTEGELSSKGSSALISASRKGANISLDNFRIKSDGRLLVEGSIKQSETLKLTMSAEDGRQEPGKMLQSSGKLGCEFTSPTLSGKAEVDIVNGPTFRSSFLYNHNSSLSLGSEIAVNTRAEEKDQYPELALINVGLSCRGPDWNLSAKTMDTFGALRISYLHNVSPVLSVCSRLDYRLKGNSQKVAFGTSYRLEDLSIVKMKVDSNAILAASFQNDISKFIKLTLCAEVDVKDWTADSHKFGIGLCFH